MNSQPNPTTSHETNGQAAFNAIQDQQRAMGWTGTPGEIANETFEDLQKYIAGRPTEATPGTHYEDTLADSDYSKMTMSQLVNEWAAADKGVKKPGDVDKTSVQDVVDELLNRVVGRDRESLEEKREVLLELLARKDKRTGRTDEEQIARDREVLLASLDERLKQREAEAKKTPSNVVDAVENKDNDESEKDDLWDRLKDIPDLEKPEPANPDYDGPVKPGNEVDLYKGDDDKTEQLPAVEMPDHYELEVPVPKELLTALNSARAEYIRLRAKRSGSAFSRVASKRKFQAAKDAYDAAHAAVGEHVAKDMLEHGKKSAEEVRMAGAAGTIWEDYFTTAAISRAQERQGKHRKFYDWWARQNGKFFTKQGFKGAIAKSAAFAVVTAPIAIPAGIAGAFVGVMALGPAVGGLIGLGVGRGVARGLAGAHIEKNVRTSVAHEQNKDAFKANEARINALAADGAVIGAAESSAGSFEQGNDDSRRNKRRMLGGAVVGAAMAAGGAWLGHAIAGNTGGGHRPKIRGGVGHETPTTPRGIPLNPTDNRYPWVHMNEVLGNYGDAKGGANSTPAIKALVDRGKEYGIDFVGKGRGIASVTIDGQTFTDNAHINAAFDETLRRVLEDEAAKAVAPTV